jgi:hypothetical protein
MHKRIHVGAVLVLACVLLLAACKDKHEPTKPTVGASSAPTLLA